MMVITDVMVDYSIAILPMFEIGARGLIWYTQDYNALLVLPTSTTAALNLCNILVLEHFFLKLQSQEWCDNSLFPKSCDFL